MRRSPRRRQPRVSPQTRPKRPPKPQSPGPGQYNPRGMQKSPSATFRGATRAQAARVFAGTASLETVESPGPAMYGTLATTGEDAAAFSFGVPSDPEAGRIDFVGEQAYMPGPGDYRPPTTVGRSVDSRFSTAPTAGFGCGVREQSGKQYSGANFTSPGGGSGAESPGFKYAKHWSTMGKQPHVKSAPAFSIGGGATRFAGPVGGGNTAPPTEAWDKVKNSRDYGPRKSRGGRLLVAPGLQIVDCQDARGGSAATQAAVAKLARNASEEHRQILREKHELKAHLNKAHVRKRPDYSWLRVHGDQARLQQQVRQGMSRSKLDGVPAPVFGTAYRFAGGGIGGETASPGPAYRVPSDFDLGGKGFSFSSAAGSGAPTVQGDEPGPGSYDVLLDQRVRAEIDYEYDCPRGSEEGEDEDPSLAYSASAPALVQSPVRPSRSRSPSPKRGVAAAASAPAIVHEEKQEEDEEKGEEQGEEHADDGDPSPDDDPNPRPGTAGAVLAHAGPVIARPRPRTAAASVRTRRTGGMRKPRPTSSGVRNTSSVLSRPSTAKSARQLYKVASKARFGSMPGRKAPNVSFGTSGREQMRALFAPGELNRGNLGRDSPGPAAHGDAMPAQLSPRHSFGGQNIPRGMTLASYTDRGPERPHTDFGDEKTTALRRAPRPKIGTAARDAALRMHTPNMESGGSALDNPGPELLPAGMAESGRGPRFPKAQRSNEGVLADMSAVPGPGAYNVRRLYSSWDDWRKLE